MALTQLPSNIYAGYAQVFNEAPHVAFRTRLMQQREAHKQSIDDYFRKLPLTINEKGIRDNERPSIAKSMLGIKDFYIKNKEALRNGDQAAAFNYEKKVRDHQDLVGTSQRLGMTKMQLGKLRSNPAFQYIFDDPIVKKQIELDDLPADHPDHVDFDLESATLPPKPFDPNKDLTALRKLKFDKIETRVPTGDGYETVTTTPTVSKDVKSFIRAEADVKYTTSPSFKKFIDDLSAKGLTPQFNSKFKELYGMDIESDYDLAAAYLATTTIPEPTTTKVKLDKWAMEAHKDADWFKRNKITFGQRKQIAAIARSAGQIPPETGYLSDEVADEVGVVEPIRSNGKDENRIVIYADKVDPDRLNIITGRDISKNKIGVKPIEILQPDGTYRKGYFQDPDSGDLIGLKGQTISREAVKDRYVNQMSPTKFKATSNTKAVEKARGVATPPKSTKVKGTSKRLW